MSMTRYEQQLNRVLVFVETHGSPSDKGAAAEVRAQHDGSGEAVAWACYGKSSLTTHFTVGADAAEAERNMEALGFYSYETVPLYTHSQPAQKGSVPEETAERVLAALGHYHAKSTRCRARYKDEQTKTDGPKNSPIFCVLDGGHDGPHRGQHGAKMRDNLIEFGPAISVCAKCKVRWPCPDAEKVLKAIATPQPEGDGWIKCSERMPTEADADCDGDIRLKFPEGTTERRHYKRVQKDIHADCLWMRTGCWNPPAEQEGE